MGRRGTIISLVAIATLALVSLVLVIVDPTRVSPWLTLLALIGFSVVHVLRLRELRKSEDT